MDMGKMEPGAKNPLQKCRVLVVDDDPAAALTMVYKLTLAGCEVEGTWNREKARHMIAGRAFDLIALNTKSIKVFAAGLAQQLDRS